MKNKKTMMLSCLAIVLSLLIISSYIMQYDLKSLLSFNNNNKANSLTELYIKNKEEDSVIKLSRIAIHNGCGIPRLGLIYKRYLIDAGYDITETVNASHFGHTLTKVLFHKDNKSSAFATTNCVPAGTKFLISSGS